ncbi:MAG: hypothetical protein EBV17_01170 [Actinobacteria bacterium]|nr:hypothetical protein [Actinomycetota bacterium]
MTTIRGHTTCFRENFLKFAPPRPIPSADLTKELRTWFSPPLLPASSWGSLPQPPRRPSLPLPHVPPRPRRSPRRRCRPTRRRLPPARTVVAQPVVAQPAVAQPAAATASALTQLDPNALPSRGQRSDAVRLVQQTLINAGIEVKGGADGVFGVATSIALGAFQTSRGLHASQAVDFPTAQALGLIPSLESLGIPQIQVFPVQGRCSFTNTWQESRGTRLHEGVDIIAPRGNLIYAVVDGTITKVYNNASLTGNGVRLTMADGTYFFYAHLDTIAPNITVGTVVKAGQILGTNGSTGNTTTPHLHFEVHPRGGAAIDPTPIVAAVNACHITEPRPQS